ncbi:pectate lyase-like adhesive domain-containing protein [Enterococcus sp. 5H]|uniref:pectate lyase-like adhesive domain-containing protein n=1 Tax=Enterococcus sp. 5H TaxID=1229490 RepID=UPI002304C95F|nr:pectate lyase-like adhesive domain-containing protein [Enterococcus sp. 5H]MDA9472503.1 putative outer membrane protein [Enterococcus sp. 5H]
MTEMNRNKRLMYSIILMVSLLCLIIGGYFYISATKLFARPEATEESTATNESVQLDPADEGEVEQETEEELTTTFIEATESSSLTEKIEATSFIGETVEVSTFEELRLAVANSEVSQIEVQNNLVRSGTGTGTAIGTLSRELLIKGNGYTINFGANNGSLTLANLAADQAATLRVENASLVKSGDNSIFNASGTGIGWSVELEDVNTATGNASRLALIPAGRLTFTGGMNTFAQTLTNIFVEAKEVYVQNQAQVSITRGNSAVFFSAATVADSKIVISENSNVSISVARGTANLIDMRGTNPSVVVSEESTLEINALGTGATVSNTSNNAIVLSGAQPTLDVLGNSKLLLTTSESKRAIGLVAAEAKMTIESSELTVNTATGRSINLAGTSPQVLISNKSALNLVSSDNAQQILLEGANALFQLESQSEAYLTTPSGNAQNVVIGSSGTNPTLRLDGGSIFEMSSGASRAASDTANNGIILTGSVPSVEITDKSQLNLTMTGTKRALFLNGVSGELKVSDSSVNVNTASGNGIHLSGNDSKVEMKNKANVNIDSDTANALTVHGERPVLKIANPETILNARSSVSANYVNGAIYLGSSTQNTLTSGAQVEITDGAQVQAESNLASAIGIQSQNGDFVLSDDASLKLKSGASTGEAAVLRFLYFGSYNFTIDNALLEISKSGGTAPGIRMYGGNNHIEVKNGGIFQVNTPGGGTANDTSNQGVLYTSNGNSLNSFSVSDPGSSVIIKAETGPAIDMSSGNGTIDVLNQGLFQAAGQTRSASGGIFNAGILTVTFDDPLYMDFRNNRSDGGNIFNVSSGSTLTAKQSDLAVWVNGSDLDGDPNINYRTLDYSFSGQNFNALASTDKPDILNTDNFGTTGLTTFSRLSSNNARWAVADELLVPTNADKKIYGHISIPVGLYDSRSAWDDEAVVTIEVTKANGSTQTYRGKSVGHSDEEPGISIYGEEPRGGLFEITLNDYLEVGDKVEVIAVGLTSGELTPGYENVILSDPTVTFPIIPPTPAVFDSEIVLSTASTIRGYSENRDVEVTATHNGQTIDTSDVSVDSSGNFEISLSGLTLSENDEIQVFLRDKAGFAEEAGVVNPPVTNNEIGNINPKEELVFHDTKFSQATILTVTEIVDAVLTVEFTNEIDQILPGYTITIDGLIGDEIDLTKEERVVEQLENLINAGYEIAERPENEAGVILDSTEVAVRYKLQGVLSLASAPNALDFGTLTYNATTKRVEDPEFDQPLIVTDTRADTANGWSLTATLSAPMRNTSGQELVNALRYVYEGQETILDTNAQMVYLNQAGAAGSFEISNSWGNQIGTDGVKLQIGSSDTVHTGSYVGVITWKVMAGQP